VYLETPGAEVFKMVCINCHGKRADSNGFIAQNLTLLTGGVAVPADFRDGLFGPVTSPGSNAHLAFGTADLPAGAPAGWTGVSDDDRAARYMVWMALGGTEVVIPKEILTVVQETPVFGVPRLLPVTSANMLSTAKGLCVSLLGSVSTGTPQFNLGKGYLDPLNAGLNESLLHTNGDAELWLRMCTFANPAPVRVLEYSGTNTVNVPNAAYQGPLNFADLNTDRFIDPLFYVSSMSGAAVPIGNEQGQAVSVAPGPGSTVPSGWPQWPWCLKPDAGVTVPAGLPECPSAVQNLAIQCNGDSALNNSTFPTGCWDEPTASRWAVRGAMNAGFSAYLYIQSLEALAGPPPDYNQCPQ
jgi:hypothetical protein